ncbi:hypothetical protein CASFOL_031637 [Castilleja foliolosa]|uniref:MORF/ORRM1/DAG-like MORF domain-containing protein n=1 Tax=Castilleja foliolosa TaxID=1961234 RepID=A0ABD3C6M5_9LAMI
MLLKPFDVYPSLEPSSVHSISSNRHKVLRYLHDRTTAHRNAINFFKNILEKKSVDLIPVFRSDLSETIRDVDLVISVGGDGTLLQASHLMDDSIPVLGVNSDPTRPEECSEKGAMESIYSVSTKYYYAFSCKLDEHMIHKIKSLPRVKWVLPDSYLRTQESGYGGGEPFIDGKVVPYDEKYHADWLRDNYGEGYTERNCSRRRRRRKRGSRNSHATHD